MNTLLPFQIDHADRLEQALRRHRVACDLSDPGTGKTYVACAVAARLGLPVAIVCTKATIPSWRTVAQGFGIEPVLVANYDVLRSGKSPVCRLAGPKRFQWNLPTDTLLIFDEVHKCKGRKSLQAALLIAAKRQQFQLLLCSATAASNPLEMRAFGYAMGLHFLVDFYSWAMRHGVEQGRFGLEFRGDASDLLRIHRNIFPGKGSRMRVRDIPSFPDTLIEAAPIETGRTMEIQHEYEVLLRELHKAQATGNDEALSVIADVLNSRTPSVLVALTRARQQIELLKVDAMAAMARDAVEDGSSVVLLVNYKATLDALAEKLHAEGSTIHGQQDAAERQAVIAEFQANRTPVVICTIQAGGVGVSLHDPTGCRPRLALISPSFSANDIRQALGRVHRAGGASSTQRIIFAAGTVEEHTADVCRAKLSCIDLLNDGDLIPQSL